MAEESLLDRVGKYKGPKPITAFGATTLGATPQEAAMAGTKAAKEATIKKEQTLAGAERLQQQPVEVAPPMRAAETKAKQIQEVGGSLANRMQDAVKNQLATIQEQKLGQPQVNQTALGSALGLTGTIEQQRNTPIYQQASASLLKFANNPSEEEKVSTLKELRALGIKDEAVSELLQVTAQAVGAKVSEVAKGPVTVGELDLKGLAEGIDNIDQLSGVLGISKDVLSSLSVDKLPTLIQDVQQKELSTAQSLRAQLAGLSPESQQYKIIQSQLQQVQGTGVAAAEAGVTKTIQDLNLADNINIAGQEYTAKDLFEDNQLSNIITNWMLASPNSRETIISSKDYPGLVEWLKRNETALGDLVSQAETNVRVADTAIKAEEKARYDASLEGRLVNSGRGEIWDSIQSLAPELQATATSQTPEQLVAAFDAGSSLADPAVAALAGVKPTNGLVLDPTSQRLVADASYLVDKARALGNPQWLNEPAFLDLPANLKRQALDSKDPIGVMKNLKLAKDTSDTISNLLKLNPNEGATIQQLVGSVIGNSNVNINDLNNQYKKAKMFAALGDPEAKQRMKLLEDTFGFSPKNPTLGREQALLLQRNLKYVADNTDISSIINGSPALSTAIHSNKANVALQKAYVPKAGNIYSKFNEQLADGKLTDKEIQQAVKSGDEKDIKALINKFPQPKKGQYTQLLNSITDSIKESKKSEQVAKVEQAVSDMKQPISAIPVEEVGPIPATTQVGQLALPGDRSFRTAAKAGTGTALRVEQDNKTKPGPLGSLAI